MARNPVNRYLATLGPDADELAEKLGKAFTRMVRAAAAVAEGGDHGDDEQRAATLAMLALAQATAAKAYKAAATRPKRLSESARELLTDFSDRLRASTSRRPALPPMAPSIDLPPVAGELVARRPRQVSTDGGKTWVDYDSLVDADPFELYPTRR
jgi:hypothetical protein